MEKIQKKATKILPKHSHLKYSDRLKKCRVVNMWNSLPNSDVHAKSTDIFKKRLDKFWSNQEVIYNYDAKIQGNRNQSVIN